MREALDEDFIRTARAKGLSEQRVVNRHALPVATPAIAAMTGVNVSTMLINVAAIEYGFGLPGMFRTIRGAIVGRDVAVLEALVLEGVILAVVANFLVDAIQLPAGPADQSGSRRMTSALPRSVRARSGSQRNPYRRRSPRGSRPIVTWLTSSRTGRALHRHAAAAARCRSRARAPRRSRTARRWRTCRPCSARTRRSSAGISPRRSPNARPTSR